jgi:hypothetical protein
LLNITEADSLQFDQFDFGLPKESAGRANLKQVQVA